MLSCRRACATFKTGRSANANAIAAVASGIYVRNPVIRWLVFTISRRMACVDGSCIARDLFDRLCDGLSVLSCVRPVRVALPLALMSSASKVPIGFTTSEGRDIRRSVLAFG